MKQLMLFIDGSVNTQSHIGYGAYLAVSERGHSLNSLRTQVKLRRFEHTSSTKLELQTLLWALSDIQAKVSRIIVYTDSQNIMGLNGRRDWFEKNDYRSKKNKPLNNYELYQEFFRIADQLDFEFVKVPGHRVSHQKDEIDKLFTLVDRASRNAMRGDISLVAAGVQASPVSMKILFPFDHNGLFHLIEMAALAMLGWGLRIGMKP